MKLSQLCKPVQYLMFGLVSEYNPSNKIDTHIFTLSLLLIWNGFIYFYMFEG